MITTNSSLIDITPKAFSQYVKQSESLFLNLAERKMISVQVLSVRSKKRYQEIEKLHNMIYSGYKIPLYILEIITIPTNPKTTKTITHEVVYTDYNDLKNDYNQLKKMILDEQIARDEIMKNAIERNIENAKASVRGM